MDQQCPQCEKKFRLTSLKDYNDGDIKTSDYPTPGNATFCPYCGVKLDSWEAFLNKEVLVYSDEDQLEGLSVILRDANDCEIFEVYNQETDQLYQIDSKYVYTP